MVKFKVIKQKERVFLIRISIPIKKGSIKIHLILNDDLDIPHKHPWNFKSFLVFGAYKEWVDGIQYKHKPFSIINRNVNQKHQVILYRFAGKKIPCITIGMYTKKIQPWCEKSNLCDHCLPLGQCIDKKYWQSIK
ncbi:hypothetical protein [Polaribacter cellanae]|uniref:Uncharacterized protein n=1 Tax=Polaribacter cellanae TaxID=2818493 RepID=A0A975CQ49_9FLAO|nr:hypothetical protein [Polaribacter cellanae]QTE23290.1 hypothetical protein J3359_03160 [Polaribacter cellanae]